MSRRSRADILVVEPDPDDAELFRESLGNNDAVNEVVVVSNGDDALELVHRRGEYADAPRPNLVILDPDVPRTGGYEILSELKDEPELRAIPVIVLARSDEEEDVLQSYTLHANAYLRKPEDPESLADLLADLERFWLSTVRLPPAP